MESVRILTYGVTGSGKSTLALRLGELTGTPVHLVDDFCFEANWKQVSVEEQIRRVREIVGADEWILDSAYGNWLTEILPRCDLIVGLDYSRGFTFWRLLRRSIRRAWTGEPCCNGNRETFSKLLSLDSILLWHAKSFARKRQRIRTWAADPPGMTKVLRFTQPRDLERWLQRIATTPRADDRILDHLLRAASAPRAEPLHGSTLPPPTTR